jgi:hypothetical protein
MIALNERLLSGNQIAARASGSGACVAIVDDPAQPQLNSQRQSFTPFNSDAPFQACSC